MELEESFCDLNHFQFVELLLEWVIKNKAPQADLDRLWGKVRQRELCWRFLCIILMTIENIPGKLTVPQSTDQGNSFYEYSRSVCFKLKNNCNLSISSLEISKDCYNCGEQYAFKIKLVDTVAGYELEMEGDHIIVDHCYIFWRGGGTCLEMFSLLTNSYDAALEKVSQSLQLEVPIYIEFVYKCTQ